MKPNNGVSLGFNRLEPLSIDREVQEDLTWPQVILNVSEAAIIILAYMIGAGFIVLPFAMATTGWVTGTILLCLSAALQLVVFYCITKIQFQFPECSSFTEMVNITMGNVRIQILKFREWGTLLGLFSCFSFSVTS